jgi:hypothetical protein
MNEQYIIKVAESYLGEQETPGNSGWVDKDFERQMRNVGWQPGHAWCSYFCELVMKKAYAGNPMLLNAFDKLFSPSATATFSNFAGSKMFPVLKKPEPGALVVWRYGQGWTGHIGIVTSELQGSSFKTIEGNTNKAGEREGMFVMRKTRMHGATVLSKGLNLLGYIKVAR